MQIQVDLPEDLNKCLKQNKVDKDFTTLQESLIDVLREHFKQLKLKSGRNI